MGANHVFEATGVTYWRRPSVVVQQRLETGLAIMKSAVLLSILIVLLSPAIARETHNATFVIAGGQSVSLPITDAGPISAENDKAKILVAGFGIVPSKQNERQAALLWGFDFEVKSGKQLESVVVDEVSPSQTAVTLVEDNAPVLKNGVWSGTAKSIPANSTSTPWLYSKKQSVYVFRFTIRFAGEPAFVLYQPTWFSGPAKESFQQMISRIEHG